MKKIWIGGSVENHRSLTMKVKSLKTSHWRKVLGMTFMVPTLSDRALNSTGLLKTSLEQILSPLN
jgi:hypothetical protein